MDLSEREWSGHWGLHDESERECEQLLNTLESSFLLSLILPPVLGLFCRKVKSMILKVVDTWEVLSLQMEQRKWEWNFSVSKPRIGTEKKDQLKMVCRPQPASCLQEGPLLKPKVDQSGCRDENALEEDSSISYQCLLPQCLALALLCVLVLEPHQPWMQPAHQREQRVIQKVKLAEQAECSNIPTCMKAIMESALGGL